MGRTTLRAVECSNCGARNPRRARFCQSCGRPQEPKPQDWEQRKTVTVLFADVTGSTSLGEQLDPESLRRVMSRFFMEMSAILQRHGGTVEKFIGDAVMAVFGVPVVHEDDALRAVRAADEMQVALASLNEELLRAHGVTLQIRTGVNTGEVLVGDLVAGQALVTGDAVNVAARLEQIAEPGSILIGEETHRLVRDAVEVEPVGDMQLRNREEPVSAVRLLEVRGEPPRDGRALHSPLVGRIHELSVLLDAFERVATGGRAHLVTVLGTAGVGKSRLVEEFLSGLGERVRPLTGRCLPYGEGITFWPVGEVVREACGLTGDAAPAEVRERVAELVRGEEHADRIVQGVAQMIGAEGAAGSPEEMFWSARRLLESEARERPVVVLFDDVQWGEPTFLDFVEYLTDFASGPLLVVCPARPDLLDRRPDWGAGRSNTSRVSLDSLTGEESTLLIRNLLRGGDLEPAAQRDLTETSDGNPLFIEEMLLMLIDDGVLEQRDGGWAATGDVSVGAVPPTIQALLAARLERLDPGELALIQRASVEGKVFHWGAVAELTPDGERASVGAALQSLVRKELIVPDAPALAGEDAFRFRHMMIQDAAYRAIPKEVRSDLHERFAAWLERRVDPGMPDLDEILGRHLEQAHRYRAELGPLDDHGRDLGARGAERLAAAGRRAFGRGDIPGALRLLPRAAKLLPSGHPARPGLLAHVGQALMEHGELERADEVLADAEKAAAAVDDRAAEATARLSRLLVRLYREPEGATDAIRAEVDQVAPVFEELGDEHGLARVARLRTEIDWMGARYGAVEESLERTIAHAGRAGDRRMEMDGLGQLASAVLFGPTPAETGLRRCREILDRSDGDRRVEAAVLSVEAELRAMLGRFEGTREQIVRAREILEDLGLRFRSTAPSEAQAFVEMLAGDPAAAERELLWGYEALERMGERGFLSTTAAELAQAVWAQGRYEDAERYVAISEETGASDDLASQVPARSVRAKLLAREGKGKEAERLAREAVKLAARSDNLNMRGDALVDLAEVLAAAGRKGEAAAALGEAEDLYERKGNVVSARRAREAAGPASGG